MEWAHCNPEIEWEELEIVDAKSKLENLLHVQDPWEHPNPNSQKNQFCSSALHPPNIWTFRVEIQEWTLRRNHHRVVDGTVMIASVGHRRVDMEARWRIEVLIFLLIG